ARSAHRGRPAAGRPARHPAPSRGVSGHRLLRRNRRSREGGFGPVRPRRRRRDAARDGRPGPHGRAACSREPATDPHAHGPRHRGRPRHRAPIRGRRLPRQAVRVRGAARADRGARETGRRGGAVVVRRGVARPAGPPREGQRARGGADRQGVRPPGMPAAQRRPRDDANRAQGARLGLRVRRPDEGRRPVRALPAQEARRGRRYHPDGPRRRLRRGSLMFRSLRFRMAASHAAVLAIIMLALGGGGYTLLARGLDRAATDDLRTAARAQVSRIVEEGHPIPPPDSDVPSTSAVQVAVFFPDGVRLGEQAEAQTWLRPGARPVEDLTVAGERVRLVTLPARRGNTLLATVVAARSLEPEERLLQRVRLLLLAGGAVAIGLSLVAGWWL